MNSQQNESDELELLYRASEALNAAFSVEAILGALRSLRLTVPGIGIGVFEHWDHRRGSSIELYAWHPARPGLFQGWRPFSEFPLALALTNYEIVTIDDVAVSHELDETSRNFYAQVGVRAVLTVTLRQNERCAGILAFFSTAPTPFTDRDRRLAGGIGKLVFTALERIRLQKETEAAWQRAELLAQIEKSLSRASSEEDILDAVSLFAFPQGAACMTLYYLDYDLSHNPNSPWPNASAVPVAVWKDGQCVPVRAFLPPPVDRPGIELEWWEHGFDHVLYIEDISQDSRISEEDRRRFAKIYSAHSMVVFLLFNNDHLFGILAVYWPERHTFTAEERYVFWQILQTLTAVVALRRAYLAAHEHGQQMQAVARVSAAATMLGKEDDLLEGLSQRIRESFECQFFVLYLADGTGELLIPRVGSHPRLATLRPVPISEAEADLARAVRELKSIPMQGPHPEEVDPMLLEVAIPLVASQNCIGVFAIYMSDTYPMSASMRLALTALADLIAVAIQNARLYQQAQEVAAYQERNRLARQLHDSVSQSLYGISLGVHTARRLLESQPPVDHARIAQPLDYTIALADAGLKEMRALIFDLRPDSLVQEGLTGALIKQVDALSARHSLVVEADLAEEPELPLHVKEALYWIAREALHNVVKHARATAVTLALKNNAPDCVQLTIRDNGVGFDPSGHFPGHLGLRSMRERILRLGGDLEITSAPGAGTTLKVEFDALNHIAHR